MKESKKNTEETKVILTQSQYMAATQIVPPTGKPSKSETYLIEDFIETNQLDIRIDEFIHLIRKITRKSRSLKNKKNSRGYGMRGCQRRFPRKYYPLNRNY